VRIIAILARTQKIGKPSNVKNLIVVQTELAQKTLLIMKKIKQVNRFNQHKYLKFQVKENAND
jgi:hypothetical protein